MRLLVTAGNTQVPIDAVRCVTNIFTGRTGARLALHGHAEGHDVVLLTSHPETVTDQGPRWRVEPYRTFDDLARLMERFVTSEPLDAIIHCAAVSDYLSAGVYAPADGTTFDPASATWQATAGPPAMIDRSTADKVKSDEPELWLRMTRAPKLIDRIRRDWGWGGVLVKFKLEVNRDDATLLAIAEKSRTQSGANLMVANTLEEADRWAFIGPVETGYAKVARADLPARLFAEIRRCHEREACHG